MNRKLMRTGLLNIKRSYNGFHTGKLVPPKPLKNHIIRKDHLTTRITTCRIPVSIFLHKHVRVTIACREQPYASNDAHFIITHYLVQQSTKRKQLARFIEALCFLHCKANQIFILITPTCVCVASPEFTSNRYYYAKWNRGIFTIQDRRSKLSPA